MTGGRLVTTPLLERRIVLFPLKMTCLPKRPPMVFPEAILRLVVMSVNGAPRGTTKAKLYSPTSVKTDEAVSTRSHRNLGVTNKAITNRTLSLAGLAVYIRV